MLFVVVVVAKNVCIVNEYCLLRIKLGHWPYIYIYNFHLDLQRCLLFAMKYF